MMTDRELLERAARAAGLDLQFRGASPCLGSGPAQVWWNPLDDDGDALRLAVRLRLELTHNHPRDSVRWVTADIEGDGTVCLESFEDEAQRPTATRRVIVRAAAAMVGEAA